MPKQNAGVPGRVDSRDVADVVAVVFEEADGGVFRVGVGVVGADIFVRPVEAHLVGTPRRRGPAVQAVAAVAVVGLPRGVGCLEQQARVTAVVAHDERDLIALTGGGAVQPLEVGNIFTRDRRRRDVPQGRHGPVPAVDEAGSGVLAQTGRLGLGQRHGWRQTCHQPRAISGVPAEPIDVDAVGRRRGLDLEAEQGPDVGARRRREADDVGARRLHLPGRLRRPWQGVLAGDLVRDRGDARVRCVGRCDATQRGQHEATG